MTEYRDIPEHWKQVFGDLRELCLAGYIDPSTIHQFEHSVQSAWHSREMAYKPEPALKPCAHCGGEIEIKPRHYSDETLWWFHCIKCGITGMTYQTRLECITAANRRPEEPAKQGLDENTTTADEVLSNADIDEDFTGAMTYDYEHGKCKKIHISRNDEEEK